VQHELMLMKLYRVWLTMHSQHSINYILQVHEASIVLQFFTERWSAWSNA